MTPQEKEHIENAIRHIESSLDVDYSGFTPGLSKTRKNGNTRAK